jgi:hypothetical protein
MNVLPVIEDVQIQLIIKYVWRELLDVWYGHLHKHVPGGIA